mmetsp:Transcript_34188/g.102046  ORF Transcript_34188/g.102046 Transcript_34188/m.102046 type:complete len:113 (+) Transcript_34188:133-471(+)
MDTGTDDANCAAQPAQSLLQTRSLSVEKRDEADDPFVGWKWFGFPCALKLPKTAGWPGCRCVRTDWDCKMEFTYKNTKYTGCTNVDHNDYWCSEDRIYRGRWRTCSREQVEC